MLLDAQNQFSNAQAITATAASTNVIDTGSTKDDGKAANIPLLIQCVEDFNNLTSLTATLQTDDAEGFGSAVDLYEVTIPLADLVAGYQTPVITLPQGVKRYLRLNYTVTGATAPTAGAVTAGLVAGVQTNG